MYTTTQKENQTAENVTPAAVSPIRLQPKLSIGAVNDPMEYEADAMADKVMSMHELPSVAAGNAGGIQRKCSHCEEEEKVQRKPLASFIQRKESSAVTVASDSVSNQINATKGSGSSMDRHTQSFMQNRFGTDFNDVKIHTGGEAIQMNRELSAKAFTVGNDIYFNEGQYNPNSDEGKHLLAHELTHTVQQSDLVLKKVQKKCTSEAPDKDETIYTTGEGEAKKKYSYAEESSAEAFISKHPELNLICHKIKEAAGYVFTIYLKSKSPDPSPKDPEKKSPDDVKPVVLADPVFALTFDDGPHAEELGKGKNRTENVLDVLKTEGIKGAFFIQTGVAYRGASANGKTLVERMTTDGHIVGIHTGGTIDHELHTEAVKKGTLEKELADSKKYITENTSQKSADLVRPPTGKYNADVESVYAKLGLKNLLWDIDGDEGKNLDIATLKVNLDKGLAAAKKNSWKPWAQKVSSKIVVLYHDIQKGTADNLSSLITYIRDTVKALSKNANSAKFDKP